jgi:hypothetical protein
MLTRYSRQRSRHGNVWTSGVFWVSIVESTDTDGGSRALENAGVGRPLPDFALQPNLLRSVSDEAVINCASAEWNRSDEG